MKNKPVLRIKKHYDGRYTYTHVRGNLKQITESETYGHFGYFVKLSIGLTIFEPIARR